MLSPLLQTVSDGLATSARLAWSPVLVGLLVATGLLLGVYSRFLPLRAFGHALRVLRHPTPKTDDTEGISAFAALSTALAATIGMGNMAGIAVALSFGGPGAIFWMWVAGLVGTITKFFETSATLLYRSTDYKGDAQAGAMYALRQLWAGRLGKLATFFAVCGLLGTLPAFNVNQLSYYFHEEFAVPRLSVGLVMAGLVAFILGGGFKRLAAFSCRLVPIKCLIYFACAGWILTTHREAILPALQAIFANAMAPSAAFSGGILFVMQTGFRRATFSSEAGIGTSPMAYGSSVERDPIRLGLIAMLGPSIDTLLISTVTALLLLVGFGPELNHMPQGVLALREIFARELPLIGRPILSLILFLFSLTTVFGMANYNLRCWDYLFQGRPYLRDLSFRLWICSTIVVASVSPMVDVINLIDTSFALMVIPNLVVTIAEAPRVLAKLQAYLAIHKRPL